MVQTRWQPFADLWNRMDRLTRGMNELFVGEGWPNLAAAYPPVNLWEDADNLYVEAELPGMDLADLEIVVTGANELSLQGERKEPTVENSAWHRQERGFGKFQRTIALPFAVEADKVEARFVNGVLTITLPKAASAKPRKIAVKAE